MTLELIGALNNWAGTTGLEFSGVCNRLAGTTGLEGVGVLNVLAGTQGLELSGVLNRIAGTTGLGPAAAANQFVAPKTIPDLKLWLEASRITGLNDGDSVTTWSDLSGNGNDVTRAVASQKPIFKTSVVNGKDVVRFDGTDDFLRSAVQISTATAGTVVAVVASDVVDATSHAVWGSADEATSGSHLRGRFPNNNSAGTIDVVQQNAGDTTGIVRGGTALTASTFYILVWSSSGTAYTLRVNGAAQALTVVAGANNGDWFGDTSLRDNFTVGALRTTVEQQFFDGDMAEFLIYDHDLTPTELNPLGISLKNKYALTWTVI